MKKTAKFIWDTSILADWHDEEFKDFKQEPLFWAELKKSEFEITTQCFWMELEMRLTE